MRLDAETIYRLMEESDRIDPDSPQELFDAACKLIYPVIHQECPATPPLDQIENQVIDETLEAQKQYQLDLHVLGLLRKSWLMLTTAKDRTNNPKIVAACQREQALLILRLMHNKNHFFTLSPKMLFVIEKRIIGPKCYTKSYAEQLLNLAGNAGDLIAQFCCSRYLILVAERVKPSQAEAEATPAHTLRQCFHSWLESKPEFKSQLRQFSSDLSKLAHNLKPQYLAAVKSLISGYHSIDLITFLTAPKQLPLVKFLKSNMPTLCVIAHAFSANWNEIRMTPVATQLKASRKRLYHETFPLDRSQSAPRPTTQREFFFTKKRSDPKLHLIDPSTNKRQRNPSDCILK